MQGDYYEYEPRAVYSQQARPKSSYATNGASSMRSPSAVPRPVSASPGSWGDRRLTPTSMQPSGYGSYGGYGGGSPEDGGGGYSERPQTARTARTALSPERTRNHAQAIAMSREPERMGEDILALKQALTAEAEARKRTTVEKRRLESEVAHLKTQVARMEQALASKAKRLSPGLGGGGGFDPDRSSLVNRLKEQNRELAAQRDSVAAQLAELQRATRSTRLAEAEAQAEAFREELERQHQINAVMRDRMDKAELVAQASREKADRAMRMAQDVVSQAGLPPSYDPADGYDAHHHGDVDHSSAPINISAATVKRNMPALFKAHKVLYAHAQQLRASFPPSEVAPGDGAQFAEHAAGSPRLSGALQLLEFLRMHGKRLELALDRLPGSQPLPAGGGPATASSPPPRSTRTPTASARTTRLNMQDPHALLQAVAAGVEQLRVMEADEYQQQPAHAALTAQLADVMALYVDEVKRLQQQGGGGGGYAEPLWPPPEITPRRSDAYTDDFESIKEPEPAPQQQQQQQDEGEEEEEEARGDEDSRAAAAERAAAVAGAMRRVLITNQVVRALQTKEQAFRDSHAEYKVTVVTGVDRGAGTNSNVFIELVGVKNGKPVKTGRTPLDGAGAGAFERGKTDKFTLTLPDIGELTGIVIGHDGKGSFAAWQLKEVEVLCVSTGQAETFTYGKWLEAPGQIEVELAVGSVGGVSQKEAAAAVAASMRRALVSSQVAELLRPKAQSYVAGLAEYVVAVETGGKHGAGTDSKVFLELVGNKDGGVVTSGRATLDGAGRAFERGKTDTFTLSLPDVGELTGLLIGHDGSGFAPTWHLKQVTVACKHTGQTEVFVYDDWLEAPGKAEVELYPSLPPPQQKEEEEAQLQEEVHQQQQQQQVDEVKEEEEGEQQQGYMGPSEEEDEDEEQQVAALKAAMAEKGIAAASVRDSLQQAQQQAQEELEEEREAAAVIGAALMGYYDRNIAYARRVGAPRQLEPLDAGPVSAREATEETAVGAAAQGYYDDEPAPMQPAPLPRQTTSQSTAASAPAPVDDAYYNTSTMSAPPPPPQQQQQPAAAAAAVEDDDDDIVEDDFDYEGPSIVPGAAEEEEALVEPATYVTPSQPAAGGATATDDLGVYEDNDDGADVFGDDDDAYNAAATTFSTSRVIGGADDDDEEFGDVGATTTTATSNKTAPAAGTAALAPPTNNWDSLVDDEDEDI